MNLAATGSRLEVPTPAELAELEARIQHRLAGRVRDFRLSLRDGCLVLSGAASSYYAKQVAQHAVMEVLSMPIGQNQIEVTKVAAMETR
jgi:hypothetical protein